MKNGFETMEEMQRMQQEAVRRVHEMQRRAKQTLLASEKKNDVIPQKEPNATKPALNDQTQLLPLKQNEKQQDENTSCINKKANSNKNFDLFSSLTNDPEKSLILVLILLLLDEGADLSLVFALMYLMF